MQLMLLLLLVLLLLLYLGVSAGTPHSLLRRLGRRSIRFVIATGLGCSGLVVLLLQLLLLTATAAAATAVAAAAPLLPLALPLDGGQCLGRCE